MKLYVQIATFLLYLLLLPLSLTAITVQTYSIGSQRGWDADIVRDNISIVRSKQARPKLHLSPSTLSADAQTDLFLDFDKHTASDVSGNFVIDPTSTYELSDNVKKHGSASALIYPGNHIKLQALQTQVFAPNQIWDDISIEFWLYPLTTQDGQRIFLWRGSHSHASRTDYQSIYVYIQNNKIVWEFNNIFTNPKTMEAVTVVLTSAVILLPKQWHYHALRYDSTSASIEYSMDMDLNAMVYTTVDGRAGSQQMFPRILANNANSFYIGGERMMGLIDNFLIHSGNISSYDVPDLVHNPMTTLAHQGSFVSRAIDMGNMRGRIRTLQADYKTPGTSTLFFYYRAADTIVAQSPERALDAQWVYFNPNAPFPEAVESRYIQFKVIFLSDKELQKSPEVKSMVLYYYRNEAVFPPPFLKAIPQEHAVLLEWAPVHDSTLAGYQVYYGTKKSNFLGVGSSLGDSPIFVDGGATSLLIKGLSPETLYYFAVSSVSKYGQAYGMDIRFSPVKAVHPLPNMSVGSTTISTDSSRHITKIP